MIPVTLCIDVEPDDHVFAPSEPSSWSGFEQMLRDLPQLRDRLAVATGGPVHFGWSLRIDLQIELAYGSRTYLAEKYGSQLEQLVAEGDALGVHPHAWRWDPERHVTVADHGDSDFADECAGMAVSLFAEVFGRLPDYHRYGAQYMSTSTMNLLNGMGVPVDLTIEPGEPPDRDADLQGTVWTGHTGDFRQAPRDAYRPSREDYLRPAGPAECAGGLWELPLTSGRLGRMRPPERDLRSLALHPAGTSRRAFNYFKYLKQVRHQARTGPDYRLLAMWLDWAVVGDFWDAALEAASLLEKPHIAFAIRTDVGSVPVLRDRFGRIMDALLAHDICGDLRFATPAEALATLVPPPTHMLT